MSEKWEYNTDKNTVWEITYKIKDSENVGIYLADNKNIYEAIKEFVNNKNNIERLISINDLARGGKDYNFNKLKVLDMEKVNEILSKAI